MLERWWRCSTAEKKKGNYTKPTDSTVGIADPEKVAKKRKVLEEMPDNEKGCSKDSGNGKIKSKKEKRKKKKKKKKRKKNKKDKKTKKENKEPKPETSKAKAKPKAKNKAKAKPSSDESFKRSKAEQAQATMVATLARVQKEYAEAIAEPEPKDEQGLEARKRHIAAKKVVNV